MATTTVTLATGECELDSAVITAVPPSTLHVVTLSNCGALRCWERWIETNGKRLGATRACSGEAPTGGGDRFEVYP